MVLKKGIISFTNIKDLVVLLVKGGRFLGIRRESVVSVTSRPLFLGK
jgi:hypothetical protein